MSAAPRPLRAGSGLRRSLGTLGAFTLSIAVIGPTIAMAYNVAPAARAAGRATPLAFLLGGAAVVLVALSFVAFARRVASAGSAAAYVAAVFGPRWGFLAGWVLLLAYAVLSTFTSALVGRFAAAALSHAEAGAPGLAWAVALVAGGLTIALGGREIAVLTRLMLAIEACSVLAILVLAAVVLARVPWSAAPLLPDPEKGLAGLGSGMTFAILAFTGFEGAAAVAEETRDPHRAIPWALIGSVVAVGLFYVLVSDAQVLGFGLDRIADLGRSEAPLDALSTRYISEGYGVVLDLAAAVSALGCALGSASAGARILFALGRAGFVRGFGTVDPRHGVPRRALWAIGAANILGLLAIGTWAGLGSYAQAAATIGALAAILVYAGVGVAQATAAGLDRRWMGAAVGLVGAALLGWPLATSVDPAQAWPGILWPLVVAAWTAVGAGIARSRAFGRRVEEPGGGPDPTAIL